MTQQASREATKRETREALVTAGMLEFAEHGLDAPSLDQICARAGKTRGAFYVHFADRDELLAAVVERVLTTFYDAVITAGDLQQTVAAYIAAVDADAPGARNRGPWRFGHTLAACAPAVRQRYAALQSEAIARVTHTARVGQRAGTIRADLAPERLGELLVLLTLGIAAMRQIGAPFDLHGGAAALATLLAPATPRGRSKRRATSRR
jgi:TetR/AcrR family transcriptional regulator, transcriptional repressor for nem operon